MTTQSHARHGGSGTDALARRPHGWPFMGDQIRGFGHLHDGSIPSLFIFPSDVQRRQVEAFVFALDTGLKPSVGQQLTVGPDSFTAGAPPVILPDVDARLDLLMARADAGDCELILKVVAQVLSARRGGVYLGGGLFQLDRLGSRRRASRRPRPAARDSRSVRARGGTVSRCVAVVKSEPSLQGGAG